MASLEISIEPSTLCSASESCGGIRPDQCSWLPAGLVREAGRMAAGEGVGPGRAHRDAPPPIAGPEALVDPSARTARRSCSSHWPLPSLSRPARLGPPPTVPAAPPTVRPCRTGAGAPSDPVRHPSRGQYDAPERPHQARHPQAPVDNPVDRVEHAADRGHSLWCRCGARKVRSPKWPLTCGYTCRAGCGEKDSWPAGHSPAGHLCIVAVRLSTKPPRELRIPTDLSRVLHRFCLAPSLAPW